MRRTAATPCASPLATRCSRECCRTGCRLRRTARAPGRMLDDRACAPRPGCQTTLVGEDAFRTRTRVATGFDTMRIVRAPTRAATLGPISAARATDCVDDYHELARSATDTTTGDSSTASRSQSSPGAYRFPCTSANAHPTNWIEREAARRCSSRAIPGGRCCSSFPSLIRTRRTTPPAPYSTMYAPEDSRLPASGAEANAALPMVVPDRRAEIVARANGRSPTRFSLRTFSAVAARS